MKINAGNLKKGQYIFFNDGLWQIQKTEFYSPGKGSALMKTVLKNLENNKTLSYTFKSNEEVEVVEIEVVELQYLYKDKEFLYFMNEKTFEQYQLPIKVAGEVANYLTEGIKLYILMYENKPIGLRPPQSVRLKVIKAEEAVKGDTVSGAEKWVTVETGVKVSVPLFIKTGDVIIINPQTGEYIGRVGSS